MTEREKYDDVVARLPLTTAPGSGSSTWPTGVWRPAPGEWRPMSSSRTTPSSSLSQGNVLKKLFSPLTVSLEQRILVYRYSDSLPMNTNK